ncbi:MAG: histidine kinase [Oscillospiraceae bacterium]|nr:histidine kinase [Oscillospiraceae bacterium]
MTELQKWNTAIEIWGVILFAGFGIMVAFQIHTRREKRNLLLMIVVAIFAVAGFALGELTDASPNPAIYSLCRLGNAVNYGGNFTLLGLLALWVNSEVFSAIKLPFNFRKLVLINYAVMLAFWATNWLTHWLYYFDEAHRYVRGPLYVAVMGICGFELLLALVLQHWYNRKLPPIRFLFYLDLFILLMGVVLQTVFYGLATINIAMIVCILMHILWMQKQATDELIKSEREVAERRYRLQAAGTGLALGRLQPHFLYNTLNTIYYLCGENPETARKAVRSFSHYLRNNMDAMSTLQPVPFEEELEHVKTYLELELVRFEERLKVNYDIGCKDFRLPLLTIQTLAENSVKYGLCEKPNGGTITIQTRRLENGFQIKVLDDGIGFDINRIRERLEQGTTAQVRNRVADMCGGDFQLESHPGQWTCATIRLPETMALEEIQT